MRTSFLFLCILLFLAACDSNSEPEALIIESITFKPGQERTYEQDLILVTFDGEGNEVDRTEEQAVYIVEHKSDSEPVPEIEATIQVDQYSPEEPEFVASYWYTLNDSQLVEVAYRNVLDYVMFKEGRSQFLAPFLPYALVSHNVLSANEITVRDIPRIVFDFPLVQGKSWEALRDNRFNLVVTGEVLDSEDVDVPAGTFHCQVVKTTHAFRDSSVEILHYFTSEGLVKRVEKNIDPSRNSENAPGIPRLLERTVVLVNVEG